MASGIDLRVILFVLLMIASLCDLMWGRIPNVLTAAGLLTGLIGSTMRIFGIGPGMAMAGAVIPLIFPGCLFLFRMIGAGDVKLLCMTGAFLGPSGIIRCIIWSIYFGGVIAAVCVIRRKCLWQRLAYFQSYVRELLRTGEWKPYLRQGDEAARFCFALPITAGALAAVML